MTNNIMIDKFDVLNEFTEMYVRTAFATALEMTGCVECARNDVMERLQKVAERKALEISILYSSEWGDSGDPATSPDGISNHCFVCSPPDKPKAKKKPRELH